LIEALIVVVIVVVALLLIARGGRGAAASRKVADLRARARQTAAEILNRPSEWVIVDTETTGVSGSDVVVDIAVISADGAVLLDTLVALPPRKRISAEAASVHGITRDRLKSAPKWEDVRMRLDAAIAGRQCLAYNAPFDSRLIKQTDTAHGVAGGLIRWVDVMPVYNAFEAEWDPKRRKIKWQKLPGAQHGALADCQAVLVLLHRVAGNAAVSPGYAG
jgi:DNA polymerase III subunit epsilon